MNRVGDRPQRQPGPRARLAGADPGPGGLIEAKLTPPRARRGTVRRTGLLRRLSVARVARVVSIVAPPGYGKTSLLAQWASQGPGPVAWLTVDDGDNDPVVFLTYLAAAIGRLTVLDPDTFGAIASPAVSDRDVVGRLLAVIREWGEPFRLAIDDAHRITDRACLDALAELITYLPPASQVVIAGREPVALPLARWRADASMLELGPDDLALGEQEAAELARAHGLSPEATTQLTRKTEGWPALLALAAVEAGRSPGGQVRIDGGGDRLIADYLRSELLEGRPEAEITFLTRTSILERLSGPVCDAVAGRPGSSEMLTGLERSTLLVDEYGGSYRYHTLLRDFLQAELAVREPDRVAGLHRRAAAWYETADALDLAVEHVFAATDPDLAATMAGRALVRYHWSGRRATTRSWFRRIGDDTLGRHPWVAVLAAWEEGAAGDVPAAVRLADIAERGTVQGPPQDGTTSFESGRAMLRAGMCRAGADDALANAARAVDLEAAGSRWRDYALWQLAIARITNGDRVGAEAALSDAIDAARAAGNTGLLHCVLGHRALLAVDRHDWDAAVALAGEMDASAAAANVEGYLSSALARAARVRLSIHRGDIAVARWELARAMGLRPLLTHALPAFSVQALLAFARAHLAAGDPAGARTLSTQANAILRQRRSLGVLPGEVGALQAALAVLPPALSGGATTLTAMELRVLALLPFYLSFKEIGQRLGTKASTVKTHALSIYGKLGASSRSEAVDLAVQAGLLERFLA